MNRFIITCLVSLTILSVVFNFIWLNNIGGLTSGLQNFFLIIQTQSSENIIFLIFFLPIFSVPVIFLRQMIGIKTYGVFIPLILAFSLYESPNASILIFSYVALVLFGILVDRFVSKLNTLAVSKRSINLFLISFFAVMLYIISIYYGFGLNFLGIPFLATVYTLEKFNHTLENEDFSHAFKTLASTFLSAISIYIMSLFIPVTMPPNQLILLFSLSFAINLMLATYSGPRLTEVFRFKTINSKHKTNFLGMNWRNMNLINLENTKEQIELVNDKVAFKKALNEHNVATTKLIDIIDSTQDIEILKKVNELEAPFVLKPAQGFGGKGIVIIDKKQGKDFIDIKGRTWTITDVVKHVKQTVEGEFSLGAGNEEGEGDGIKDVVIVEEKLIPPSFFTELSESGLPDVRVIYHHLKPVAAMVRIPTEESEGKANLSKGALGAAINLKTGEITQVYSKKDGLIDKPYIGSIMPQWRRLLKIGKKAVKISGLGYAGVDIVYDISLGPIIMECNAKPGLEIQNVLSFNLMEKIDKKSFKKNKRKILNFQTKLNYINIATTICLILLTGLLLGNSLANRFQPLVLQDTVHTDVIETIATARF